MTKTKKILTTGAVLFVLAATSLTAFAASTYKTPAEAVAGLTGKTVDQIISQKQETGKTYGEIAKDAGKLEEFKNEAIQIKKDTLEEKVANGSMTRERADEIIKAIEENQVNCDGTGSAKIGQKYGAGFGKGNHSGQGMRNGQCGGNAQGACLNQ